MAKSTPSKKKKAPAKKKAAAKRPAATKKETKKVAAKKAPTRKKAAKAATKPVKKKPAVEPKAPAARSAKKVTPRKRQAGGRAGKAAAEAGLAAESLPSAQAQRPTPASPVRGRVEPDRHEAPTPQQLRKVKTGLTKKDLKRFRDLLLDQRAEIVGDVAGLEASRSGAAGNLSHMPLHMADVGSDNYEQEFTLGLMESERKTLIEIDEALQRISDGIYGVCLESAQPIARPRLEAKPWAKYTIEVAREHERHGKR